MGQKPGYNMCAREFSQQTNYNHSHPNTARLSITSKNLVRQIYQRKAKTALHHSVWSELDGR
jgi:hypothetical protein